MTGIQDDFDQFGEWQKSDVTMYLEELKECDATINLLRQALEQSLDAMYWATGSYDFSPEGTAYHGYLTVLKPAIDTASTVLLNTEPVNEV